MFDPVPELTIEKSYGSGSGEPISAFTPSSIKILSWNIARSNHSQGWVRDCRHIIETHQPTLIFLQEVRLKKEEVEDTKTALPELAELGWCFAPNFASRFDRSYSGILTAAKVQFQQSQALHSPHSEPISNTPKVSLFSEHPIFSENETPLESLLTINIHAINFVESEKFRAQLQAIESRISQHRGAVIFAGDFNTWSQKRWRSLSKMTTRLGLESVMFDRSQASKLKRFLLSPPLDHIFYRGFSQRLSSAKVIDTLSSSDHNPLLVELINEG